MVDNSILSQDQLDDGYRIGTLLLAASSWVNRRVEQLMFEPDGSVQRRVSVDFRSPLDVVSTPPSWVPIAFLDKDLLLDFDLRDEAGASVPLATREENTTVGLSVLAALAESIQGQALSDVDLNQLGRLVWDTDPVKSMDRRAQLRGSGGDFRALFQDDTFSKFTRVLATRFLLLIPFTGWTGGRVVKFSYAEELGAWEESDPGLWLSRLPGSLAWQDLAFDFEFGGFGSGFPHHLEVVAPDGLEISRSEGIGPGEGSDARMRRRQIPPRAHFLFPGGVDLDSRAFVSLSFYPPRTGFLRSAFLATLLVAVVMSSLALYTPTGNQPTSVLLALPGILALVVAGKGEHPLLTAMLLGLRSVVVGSALLVFGAAFQLSGGIPPLCLTQLPLTQLEGCALRPTWAWGAVLAWLLFVVTLPSMVRAGNRFGDGQASD